MANRSINRYTIVMLDIRLLCFLEGILDSLHKVFILGDGYSTYAGYIPMGYDTYYGDDIENGTDVHRVEQTWWHQLIAATNSRLIANYSWSGTTICNTGYGGPDAPNSFIRRFDQLIAERFF